VPEQREAHCVLIRRCFNVWQPQRGILHAMLSKMQNYRLIRVAWNGQLSSRSSPSVAPRSPWVDGALCVGEEEERAAGFFLRVSAQKAGKSPLGGRKFQVETLPQITALPLLAQRAFEGSRELSITLRPEIGFNHLQIPYVT